MPVSLTTSCVLGPEDAPGDNGLPALRPAGLAAWASLAPAGGHLLGWSFIWQLVYYSFFMRAQIGYRFALMLLPVAFILAALGFVAMLPRRGALAAGLVVALAALETAPYLGNSLAFTNALVQPKKDAFKYLAGSSIDYGQNEGKVGAWLKSKGWPNPHFEPNHMRPGVNVMSLNMLAGVVSGRAHRFIRENVEPQGHFRHTYLWFEIDPVIYDRFLEEDRRLVSRPRGPDRLRKRKRRAAGRASRTGSTFRTSRAPRLARVLRRTVARGRGPDRQRRGLEPRAAGVEAARLGPLPRW